MTAWAKYLTPTQAHHDLGLVCLGVGACTGKVAAVVRRRLDSYACVFISAGTGRLRCGDRELDVRGPAVFWLAPRVEHSYTPDPDGWNEWWTLFEGPASDAYLALGYLPAAQPLLPVVDPAPLELAFASLARACRKNHPDADVEAASAMHSLLVAGRRSTRPHDLADGPVLTALLENAYAPSTVAEHARRLGMSEATLRKHVQRAAGCSPREFIIRARINRAKELLATTDLPMTAVARRVGYADPAYFTRQFSQRAGVPPSNFRKAQWRGAND